MKTSKLIASVFFAALLFTNSKAQDNSESDKCVKEGTFIIDGFYGYPYYIGKYVNDISKDNSTSTDYTNVTNLNHLGGKFEYMLNKVVGLGLEYTYASVNAKYNETRTVNVGGVNQLQTTNYTASITKQRILAKVNIHFATSKYLDPYATGGIGYKGVLAKTDNPYEVQDTQDLNQLLNILPISFRLGIGLRYYFIKNLGVGIEAGLGGPIIQGGLSLKF